MDGYPTFRKLTLQRWERIVIVQYVSPLVTKGELEVYFKQFGDIERVWFIHNPENGCCMKKALVLMKSPRSAALITDMKHHRISTAPILSNEIGMEEFVTTVKYRGSVKKYTCGRYKLYLGLTKPWKQVTVDNRILMGLFLTRELVRAFRGFIFTSIDLYTDKKLNYTGFICIRFEFKNDEEEVMKITKEVLKNGGAIWRDAEDKDFWNRITKVDKTAQEKVDGDMEGDDSDVESLASSDETW